MTKRCVLSERAFCRAALVTLPVSPATEFTRPGLFVTLLHGRSPVRDEREGRWFTAMISSPLPLLRMLHSSSSFIPPEPEGASPLTGALLMRMSYMPGPLLEGMSSLEYEPSSLAAPKVTSSAKVFLAVMV